MYIYIVYIYIYIYKEIYMYIYIYIYMYACSKPLCYDTGFRHVASEYYVPQRSAHSATRRAFGALRGGIASFA